MPPDTARAPAARRRLGLIVNPFAGVGGRVGLKGSDGTAIVREALERGAARDAPRRARLALERLVRVRDRIEIVTWPGEMGEDEARAAGFEPTVVGSLSGRPHALEALGEAASHGEDFLVTSGADTEQATRDLVTAGVELLLFAGGDGTARNVCHALGGDSGAPASSVHTIPALGIPAGVKIHSAVYANTPAAAGDLAAQFLVERPQAVRLREAEVMDIDEAAFREDRVSARLYGYLHTPFERTLVQGAKAGGVAGDAVALQAIAHEIMNAMQPGVLYLLGPGTTVRAVATELGLPKTLLGVDAVRDRALVASDLGESDILALVEAQPPGAVRIVVTVIGGQGHIFGRGNQQFSAEVIRRVGRDNVIVAATQTKLLTLGGRPLLVDTGDPATDASLAGYIKVVTALGHHTMYKVSYEEAGTPSD